MEEQIVITSGRKYIDIDAYAGMFAYKKLLQSLGYEVYVTTTAILNESIPESIQSLGFKFDEVDLSLPTKYIVLDVSHPEFIDTFVSEKDIIEIIDHHTGYEDYWKEKGVKAHIEFIGSIATIIFEIFQNQKKEDLLSVDLCKLLIAAILDNTLNLKSSITTTRDRMAYQQLLSLAHLDDSFRESYFQDCYSDLEDGLEEYLKNDTKIEKVSSYLPEVFGQLIVLDKADIVRNLDRVRQAFSPYEEWMLNIISLRDGKSYLFFGSNSAKEKLESLFSLIAEEQFLELEQCMLRKEIMKLAREKDKIKVYEK